MTADKQPITQKTAKTRTRIWIAGGDGNEMANKANSRGQMRRMEEVWSGSVLSFEVESDLCRDQNI